MNNSSVELLTAPLKIQQIQSGTAFKLKESWDQHLDRVRLAEAAGVTIGMSWQDKFIAKYAADLPLADMLQLREALVHARMGDLERAPYIKLREAMSLTGFPVLQKAGIKQNLYAGYKLANTVFDQIVKVEASTKNKEEYGGLFEATLPDKVSPGEEVSEAQIGEKAAWIYNYKWAQVMSLELELSWYDQQRKIVDKSRSMGRGFRLRQEKEFVTLVIDASNNLYLTGDPAVAGALYSTAQGNLLTTAFGTQAFEDACANFRLMTDDNGNEIYNEPDTWLGPVKLEGSVSRTMKARTFSGSAANTGDDYNFARDRYGKAWKILASPMFDSDDPNDWYLANRAADQIIYQDVLPLTLAEEPDFVGEGFSKLVKRFLGVISFGLGVTDYHVLHANRVP